MSSSSWLVRLGQRLGYDYDWLAIVQTMQEVHDESVWPGVTVPNSVVWNTLVPVTVTSTTVATLVFVALCHSTVLEQAGLLTGLEDDEKNHQQTTTNTTTTTTKQVLLLKRKTAYAVVNFFFTILLTVAGLWFQWTTMTDRRSLSRTETVTGLVHDSHILYLSCWQMGWQLWALPIALWYPGVEDSSAMLVHHVAVLCVTSMTSFLHVGFRSFTPYFYGTIEGSTVLLILMNAYKQRPAWRRPGTVGAVHYTRIRLAFSAAFLLLRVLLWIPYKVQFLLYLLAAVVVTTPDPNDTSHGSGGRVTVPRLCHYAYVVNSVTSVLLSLLQLYWAFLIVQGLVRFFVVGQRKQEKKQDSKNTNTTTTTMTVDHPTKKHE